MQDDGRENRNVAVNRERLVLQCQPYSTKAHNAGNNCAEEHVLRVLARHVVALRRTFVSPMKDLLFGRVLLARTMW